MIRAVILIWMQRPFFNGRGRVSRQEDFVFYGNLTHPSESVKHLGDNLTGAGDGMMNRSRWIWQRCPIRLPKLHLRRLSTKRRPEGRISAVNNAFIRIYNEANGEELLRYDLGEDFSIETAVVFGELYKNGANGNSMQWAMDFRAAPQLVRQLWGRGGIKEEIGRCQSVYKRTKSQPDQETMRAFQSGSRLGWDEVKQKKDFCTETSAY